MNQNQQKFNAAAIGEKFQFTCTKFDALLMQSNSEELTNIHQKLHQELKTYQEDGMSIQHMFYENVSRTTHPFSQQSPPIHPSPHKSHLCASEQRPWALENGTL